MVRCALVGCGNVAEDLHMPAFAAANAEIVAVCDADAARVTAFGEKHKILCRYTDLGKMLDAHKELDFISVATPGFTHYQICCDIIDRGLHILVEKPLALHLADIMDLRERAKHAQVKVCVMHNYRFREPVIKARRALEKGLIGQIYQLNTVLHGGSLYSEQSPWLWNEKRSRALIYELAIHFLDLQIYFGGPIRHIHACRYVNDPALGITKSVYALVEHCSGATGIVDIQLFASSNFTQCEMYGTANDITIKFFPHGYRLYSGYINPLDEVAESIRRVFDFGISIVKDRLMKPPVGRRSLSHYILIDQFIKALQNNAIPIPVTIDDVLPTMEFLESLSNRVYVPGSSDASDHS